MTESTVRLTNGQRWTQKKFLDHYIGSTVSGTPTPVGDVPTPVDVDKSWYMAEGPGRYYHPGMFPIINWILNNRSLAPGTYDLATLAKRDSDIKARISNYDRDVRSPDYLLRANVFGNESAKISGRVIVGRDGSKTFRQIEVQPMDTNFDFQHNTWGLALEPAREVARRIYDPENKGISYDIQYRGPSEAPGQYRGPSEALGKGRVYDTFTDSQLNGALRKAAVYPDRMPAGLLSSVTGKPELPFVDEHRRYLNQASGGQPPASAANAGTFAARFPSPASGILPGNDMTNRVAGLAGIDPMNPTRPAQAGGIPRLSGNAPVRYVSPANGNHSPASVFESSLPTAQFVLPGDLKPAGGIADWIAGLAGVDPRSPAQSAPLAQTDQLRGFYRDDPEQPWTVQGRR